MLPPNRACTVSASVPERCARVSLPWRHRHPCTPVEYRHGVQKIVDAAHPAKTGEVTHVSSLARFSLKVRQNRPHVAKPGQLDVLVESVCVTSCCLVHHLCRPVGAS